MPYIKDLQRREELRKGNIALNAGELNYQLFYHIKNNMFDRDMFKWFVDRFLGKNPNYQRYNDMTGALVRCSKELKRRFGETPDTLYAEELLLNIMNSYDNEIGEYEIKKCIENNDVE